MLAFLDNLRYQAGDQCNFNAILSRSNHFVDPIGTASFSWMVDIPADILLSAICHNGWHDGLEVAGFYLRLHLVN